MKKSYKKFLAAAALLCTVMPMASCGGAGTGEKVHIGIMLYKDTGDDVEAIHAYTKYLSEKLPLEFTFKTGSLMDNEANLNAIADLQLAGCQGIVVSMCGDTFPGFVDKAAEGGTPIASYYGVPEDYFYYDGGTTGAGISSATSKENMNKWYVGGSDDGIRTGDEGGKYLAESYFKSVVVNGKERSIGLMHFNFTYYPKQAVACDTFITKVNDWNKANPNDKVKLYDVGEENGVYLTSSSFPGKYPGDTSVANATGNLGYSLGFSPIGDDYFQAGKHDGMTSIACFGAAGTFVYPKVASLGKDIKIYGSGFDSSSSGYSEDFGTKGKKIMQQVTNSPAESFVYPLVMLVNRIDGKDYADNWVQKASTNKYLDHDVTDRRVSPFWTVFNTNEQLDSFNRLAMYSTHSAEQAAVSADTVKNLMRRYNDKATYDDLLKATQNMSSLEAFDVMKLLNS